MELSLGSCFLIGIELDKVRTPPVEGFEFNMNFALEHTADLRC
jgi:hypothetical protein